MFLSFMVNNSLEIVPMEFMSVIFNVTNFFLDSHNYRQNEAIRCDSIVGIVYVFSLNIRFKDEYLTVAKFEFIDNTIIGMEEKNSKLLNFAKNRYMHEINNTKEKFFDINNFVSSLNRELETNDRFQSL